MTTAQAVETSVTVNNNSLIQHYVHPDDQNQPTFDNMLGIKQAFLGYEKVILKNRKIGIFDFRQKFKVLLLVKNLKFIACVVSYGITQEQEPIGSRPGDIV